MQKYFYWLVFIGTVFIVDKMLQAAPALYGYSLLDVLMSYALVGAVGTVVALLASGLLLSTEMIALRLKRYMLGLVPRWIVFALFMSIWLYTLSFVLAANHIKFGEIPDYVQALAFLVVGVVVFAKFTKPLSRWVDDTASRLRPLALISVAAFVGLSFNLWLEPIGQRYEAPIARAASENNLPNVVIIILDGLTSGDMSLYGYSLPTTPNLDRLTSTWTVYENAHSAATNTFAVLPTILTGRYPYLDRGWYRYGDLAREGKGWASLPQMLRSLGYDTVYLRGLGYNPNLYHLHPGFQRIEGVGDGTGFFGRSFLDLTSWGSFGPELMFGDYAIPSSMSAVSATGSLSEPMYATAEQYFADKSRASTRKPIFAYIHMIRPHFPYLGNEMMGKFLPVEAGLADSESQSKVPNPYPPDRQATVDQLRLRYDENILKADQQVSSLIERMRQLGLYDNSLIVITADHGMNFSSGYWGYNSPIMARAEHSIPLLVKSPGQTVGRRVTGLVSQIDIMPTVLDTVGVFAADAMSDGQSLRRAGPDDKRVVYVRTVSKPHESSPSAGRSEAALSGNLELVSRNGKLFLFNLADDPEERINVIGQQSAAVLQNGLSQFYQRMEHLDGEGEIAGAPALVDK